MNLHSDRKMYMEALLRYKNISQNIVFGSCIWLNPFLGLLEQRKVMSQTGLVYHLWTFAIPIQLGLGRLEKGRGIEPRYYQTHMLLSLYVQQKLLLLAGDTQSVNWFLKNMH